MTYTQESISALKALAMADSLGVPVYRITPAKTEILSWKLSDPPKGGNPKTEKNPLTGP